MMLCNKLSATLMWLVICPLLSSGSSFPDNPVERAITCADTDNVQQLSCDSGVIVVQSALYGRMDQVTCSEGRPFSQISTTGCSLAGTLQIVSSSCNGKKSCGINIGVVATSDPCFGTYKYLDTTYSCTEADHIVTCEGSVATLQCGLGLVINVLEAIYGRTDQSTCIYGRPSAQYQNVQCSRPCPEVAASCNGQSSCSVTASNSIFGDPCVNTYKYLEIAYVCQSPEP